MLAQHSYESAIYRYSNSVCPFTVRPFVLLCHTGFVSKTA